MGRGQGKHAGVQQTRKVDPVDLIGGYSVVTLLDYKEFENNTEAIKAAYASRGVAGEKIDELLELNKERKELLPVLEQAKNERATISKGIGKAKSLGEPADDLILKVAELKEVIRNAEARIKTIESDLGWKALALPNLPDPDVPVGDESASVVVREVGVIPEFDFEVKDHLDIGAEAGVVDNEAAVKLSGSRFTYLKGDLARTQVALTSYISDLLADKGHELIIPPNLVRAPALYGTGIFPEAADQVYKLEGEDLYLSGTSEVALANLHYGEILETEQLPLRYAAYSTCYRREAGSAGRDTKGIFRLHQFDKIEMFSFVRPEESKEEHERILGIEEEILQSLELPYRVMNIAAGDLGDPAAKKYDCEAWFPSQGSYRELTSCSNTTDYQSRRTGTRYKWDGKNEYVNTLNGTAAAVSRTLAALMENRQEEDGSFTLPEILHSYGAPQKVST